MIANVEVIALNFEPAGDVPNNPRLPVLIYKHAVDVSGPEPASVFEHLYPLGHWRAAWRYTIYAFPHFHSTAHEVLGCYRGTASLRLGHTAGTTISLEPGDAVIIPAGTGHENLGASDDFHVVGGYPVGQTADLMRGLAFEHGRAEINIARVPLPQGDPVYGDRGPLMEYWRVA